MKQMKHGKYSAQGKAEHQHIFTLTPSSSSNTFEGALLTALPKGDNLDLSVPAGRMNEISRHKTDFYEKYVLAMQLAHGSPSNL